jgi:hypothetical protein
VPIVNVTDSSKDHVADAIARMEMDIKTVATAHRGLSSGYMKLLRELQSLTAENNELRSKNALQGLHLATMADVVLGEDAEDRSDETLVREVCRMAREHAARKEQP